MERSTAGVRSGRKNARSSTANASGASRLAKCPPRGMHVQRCILPLCLSQIKSGYIGGAARRELGGKECARSARRRARPAYRGRALEVLLGADDVRGDLAERYGYVNRSLPDPELHASVHALAMRIASFDKQPIAT